MNPVVEKVYQEIKKLPGLENAVIAGGACRDELMKGPFTDIDIFFPVKSRQEYTKVLNNFIGLPEFEITGEVVNHRGIDYINDKGFVAKCDLKYLNNFELDLVGYNVPVEDYPVNIVSTFNYNIDRAYYNGELVGLPECLEDIRRNQATLSRLQDAKYMVVAVQKFERLQKKYPNIKFNTTIKLEKDDKNPKEERVTNNDITKTGTYNYNRWFYEPRILAERQRAVGAAFREQRRAVDNALRNQPIGWEPFRRGIEVLAQNDIPGARPELLPFEND
jgi:tRNA nucleotidyltransferase/poly(A) polymerase